MTLEERAACIADVSLGSARGAERRRRIYERALTMLRESESALSEALGALQDLRMMAAIMKFEPDNGQPHPLKDGVYDKQMERARAIIEKHKATTHDK